ncbi:1-aminocyclopropane-1-carboxylate oxidase homolog 1-like [Durio zibethinus]|uniref:1-aminocyclopropane-1-carboxylate oxidase homolog 1-like n=1 Tax=Durio zibethinus TaxID=66656 RepID=A0A6P5WUU3_DURZI|nr:1-aminocyclopropane-1-carboxylate oxidase homolog 1-like [Durio zibethinus]
MEMDSNMQKVLPTEEEDYDRAKELKAFDDTKAGVKGLVDAGVATIPRIFCLPPEDILSAKLDDHHVDSFQIPIIDLKDIKSDPAAHTEIVEKIKYASEKWGFFQLINHSIPQDVMSKVLAGVHRFHEQPNEAKMGFYSRENEKKVRFTSNYDLYQSKAASWRDTLVCVMAPNPPPPEEYPIACREILMEYSKHVQNIGQILFGLLSEALGLNPSHLTDMGCLEGHALFCQYYPACPEPDRTLGHAKHCDPDFLTVLLQDQIGGLQVLHQDHWIDVPPLEGALIVNIGDLLQLISNDKFRSVQHRVLANRAGPRVSVVCLFSTTHFQPSNKLCGPIKELLSASNPPLYKETLIKDFLNFHCSLGVLNNHDCALAFLRL